MWACLRSKELILEANSMPWACHEDFLFFTFDTKIAPFTMMLHQTALKASSISKAVCRLSTAKIFTVYLARSSLEEEEESSLCPREEKVPFSITMPNLRP